MSITFPDDESFLQLLFPPRFGLTIRACAAIGPDQELRSISFHCDGHQQLSEQLLYDLFRPSLVHGIKPGLYHLSIEPVPETLQLKVVQGRVHVQYPQRTNHRMVSIDRIEVGLSLRLLARPDVVLRLYGDFRKSRDTRESVCISTDVPVEFVQRVCSMMEHIMKTGSHGQTRSTTVIQPTSHRTN